VGARAARRREKLVLAAEAAVLCPPTFNQHVIADYLLHAGLAGAGRAASATCTASARRDARRPAAADADRHDLDPPDRGFYVWVTLPGDLDSKVLLPRAVTARVAFVPGTAFFADSQGRSNLRLSYCYPTPERIREGVRRLAVVLEEEVELRQTFGSTGISKLSSPQSESPSPDMA
jgi:DNA-binding transcriptional MocR family regulator